MKTAKVKLVLPINYTHSLSSLFLSGLDFSVLLILLSCLHWHVHGNQFNYLTLYSYHQSFSSIIIRYFNWRFHIINCTYKLSMFPIFDDVIRDRIILTRTLIIFSANFHGFMIIIQPMSFFYICATLNWVIRIIEYRMAIIFFSNILFFFSFSCIFFHFPFNTNNIIIIIDILRETAQRFLVLSSFQNLFFLRISCHTFQTTAIFLFFLIIISIFFYIVFFFFLLIFFYFYVLWLVTPSRWKHRFTYEDKSSL